MQDIPRQMYRGALSTTAGVLAAAPAGAIWVVKNILLTNTTGSAATATLSFNGVVAVPTVSIPANTVVSFDVLQVLNPGVSITGAAGTASAVTAHIAGIEVLV